LASVITLVLESSTYAGSTALLDGAALLAERSVAMRGREHEALMPAVAELLAECGIVPARLERVVCGAGPGSFTSLRIAASIAKGIAMASGAALVPISSLALLVASREPQVPGRYLASVDAMRGEHYVQLFEIDAFGSLSAIDEMEIVASPLLDRIAEQRGAMAIGPSVTGRGAVSPHARAARRITKMIDATATADLGSWEPRYGRLAEAQVKWETAHGRPLATG